MDYLNTIESIMLELKGTDIHASNQLKELFDYSFTGTELLLKCVRYLLEIQNVVNPNIKEKITELSIFCKKIGLFPEYYH